MYGENKSQSFSGNASRMLLGKGISRASHLVDGLTKRLS
jgi:hypothetical protein